MNRVLALALLAHHAASSPDADAVPVLPDFGTPPSAMWSGYLDASQAEDGTMLHYWYSQMENTTAPSGAGSPVVLWLNGGPGSSSILGMLQELGPVLMNATGGIMQNPYGAP